ncbi:MAG: PKD domain-containing protein, partial [Bacteroidota bacterium]
YSWSTGETGTIISTSAAGTYTAYGVDLTTGCTSSAVGVVNPLPNLCYLIEGCYEACDPTEICGPAGLTFYQWNLDGNPILGENTECLEVTASGNYSLTAQNEFGCETTSGPIILDVIDCDDPCENVDVWSEPAIINNIPDPCCFTLSYDLSFSGLQGLHIHTDDADFSYDVADIDPALDFLGGSTGSVQLVGDMGAPMPTGLLNDFITICLTDVVNDPQQVIIDWYDMENMVVCSDTLVFNCPVEPDCLYLTEQDIYCEDGQTMYEFTVCNPNDADFSVGYINFDNITPASVVATPNAFTPSPAIAPGECRSFSTILSGPGIGGETFCFNLIAHEFDPAEVDSTLCCSLDTLYCIEIPNCDPCTDVGVLDVHFSDPDDCCTEITLENNYTPGFFDEIMICSVSPNNTLTVNNFIGSGWLTAGYTGTSFSLVPNALFGNVVPSGTFTLPEICVQAGEAPPQLITIKWMRNGEVVCEDVIENFCDPDCGYLVDTEIECLDTGWFYSGTLFNTAGYTISEAHVTFNDPAFASYNQIISLGSVPSGGSFGPLDLNIGFPGVSGQEVCFTVTLHEIGSQGQYLSCCNFTHCIVLPECDFQSDCTCDESFFESVALGYNAIPLGGLDYGFNMLDFTAFNDCDVIRWRFGDGTPNVVSAANESVVHTFPAPGEYLVCLKVTRTTPDGTVCEEKFCQLLSVDFDSLVDAEFQAVPNPNNGDFAIVAKNLDAPNMIIQVFDGAQRLMQEQQVTTSKSVVQRFPIQLSQLHRGMYFIHCIENGQTNVIKVMVQ